jgi:hypothetical protein
MAIWFINQFLEKHHGTTIETQIRRCDRDLVHADLSNSSRPISMRRISPGGEGHMSGR